MELGLEYEMAHYLVQQWQFTHMDKVHGCCCWPTLI